tara:strand:- start:10181 stop:11416 length:1236 start_codon:yes stop_codon:yes gene_type:complete
MKNIKKNFFPFVIAFSALSVSASAAFYSVSGLSKLFAGASFEVLIMAGSLEVAKLVIASLLYQYWDTLNKHLRTYLTVATVVLVLITSIGIYGFLSAAYQDTYRKLTIKENETAFLDQKKQFYENDVIRYDEELKRISSNISTLSNARSQSIQVRDTSVAGGIRTTISTSELRMAQKRIEVEEQNRKNVQKKRETVADSLQKYQLAILELDNNTDVAGELGPLQYLSGLTDTPMDKIINILLLVIIFVFDPLAISLVVAANFAFDRAYPRRKETLYEVNPPEELEEEENVISWEDFVKEETYDAEAKTPEELLDEAEARMEVIGQNGNDGLHYGVGTKDNINKIAASELEVKDATVVSSQQALRDRVKHQEKPFIIKTLQENYRQKQVLYSDGTRAWIRKEDSDSNKKRYM